MQLDGGLRSMATALHQFSGKPSAVGAAQQANYPKRLLIRSRGRISILVTDEIDWIETAGNYLRVHSSSGELVMRGTMRGLEPKLDPHDFIRIHRSTIVRIDRIRELNPCPSGEYLVILRSGAALTLSRGYRARMRSLLADGLLRPSTPRRENLSSAAD